ncbi:MAG: uroporphyrinogen-III synthase [Bacteroidota bacterium]|nr:uroporphyrinogen-III synthase [Bacteroidota bacterium]
MKVKNILVSQPKPLDIDKSPYGDIIKKYNVNIEFRKFFKIEGVEARELRKERVQILDHTAIILTSRNSVDHLFRLAKEMRVEMPDTMKYFCITEATALYLQKYVTYRKRKIFHGLQTFPQLLELILKHKDEKFLFPCSNEPDELPISLLTEHKINFRNVVMYTTPPNIMKDEIDIKKYDLLVFYSPIGIKSLFTNWPDYVQGTQYIGAFGANTASAAREAGLELIVEAPSCTAPSMTMAIEQFLQKNNKK